MPPSIADRAAFYRAALWLGLVRGREVVAWADALVSATPAPPAGLIEVSVTHEHDVTALRHALLLLGPERPPFSVGEAVLGLAARHLTDGTRSFHDTCTVLRQARQGLTLPAEAIETLKRFELQGMGVDAGTPPTELEAQVRAWLVPFASSAEPFVAEHAGG